MYKISEEKQKIIDYLFSEVDSSQLGSIKGVIGNLIREINDPDSTVKGLMEILGIDPPLTAKVIGRANSAKFASAGSKKINNIHDAIVKIGFDNVKQIALTHKAFEFFKVSDQYGDFSGEKLWAHSIAVAKMCEKLCDMDKLSKGKDMYTAGLLHDIGIIIENQFFGEKFRRLIQLYTKTKSSFLEIEDMMLGINHADIGMSLALNWEFGEELCLAIGYHHNIKKIRSYQKRLMYIMRLAVLFSIKKEIGFADCKADANEMKNILDSLNMKYEDVNSLADTTKDEILEMRKEGYF